MTIIVFRRKPIIVEAEQWYPDRPVEGVKGPYWRKVGSDRSEREQYGVIETPDGWLTVTAGDWVITDDQGRSVCRDEVFQANYEPVGESAGDDALTQARSWSAAWKRAAKMHRRHLLGLKLSLERHALWEESIYEMELTTTGRRARRDKDNFEVLCEYQYHEYQYPESAEEDQSVGTKVDDEETLREAIRLWNGRQFAELYDLIYQQDKRKAAAARQAAWDNFKLEVYRALGIDRLAAWLMQWVGGNKS